jgi:hypothetical protein
MKNYLRTLRRLCRLQKAVGALRVVWIAAGVLRAAGWFIRRKGA